MPYYLYVEMKKTLTDYLQEILGLDTRDSRSRKLFTHIWAKFNIYILQIIVCCMVLPPRHTLRVQKATISKWFLYKLLKNNITFKVNLWYYVWRIEWTVIKCYHRKYIGMLKKLTYNNPNPLGMSCVSISQFFIGSVWGEHNVFDKKFIAPTLSLPYLWNNTIETV